jgi:hypothetical protein
MKNKILKGGFILLIMSIFIVNNEKKEDAMTTADKDAIKTEIQAMEGAFAAAYNSRNTDEIIYYTDDAICF